MTVEILVDGERMIVVSERGAAAVAGLLRDRIEELKRRDGARIPAHVMALLEAFEAADARRRERAQVPQVPQPQVPQPELEGSSPGEGHDLSTDEAAAQLGISPRAVRKAISERRLKATRLAGQWVIALEDLNDFEESRNGRQNQ